jgi:hypothetical protein
MQIDTGAVGPSAAFMSPGGIGPSAPTQPQQVPFVVWPCVRILWRVKCEDGFWITHASIVKPCPHQPVCPLATNNVCPLNWDRALLSVLAPLFMLTHHIHHTEGSDSEEGHLERHLG